MPAATTGTSLDRVARAVPVLVAVSGASALVYESLWMRSFGLIFGSTTDAVAMVLAVFMGGLALGSLAAGRMPSRDPLRTYVLVELGIGVTAILTLPALRALPWAYGVLTVRLGLEGAAELLGRVTLAAIVLLPATVLLGATVPLAVEVLARAGRPVHGAFGRLYLANTIGGAAGVALGPFVLLPALGVRGSLATAAGASLLVGALAWRLRREAGPLRAPRRERIAPASSVAIAAPRPALAAALAVASGASTFGIEVLWIRSYGLVIGSSVYAFNLMLLAVLLGIAVGTALYGRVRGRIRSPTRVVGWLFIVAGLAVLAGQAAIGVLPIAYLGTLRALPGSFAAHHIPPLTLFLLTMLPVTALLGLTFPLLLHLLDVEGRPAQAAAGRLDAWNTAGAVAGALVRPPPLVPRTGPQA